MVSLLRMDFQNIEKSGTGFAGADWPTVGEVAPECPSRSPTFQHLEILSHGFLYVDTLSPGYRNYESGYSL